MCDCYVWSRLSDTATAMHKSFFSRCLWALIQQRDHHRTNMMVNACICNIEGVHVWRLPVYVTADNFFCCFRAARLLASWRGML